MGAAIARNDNSNLAVTLPADVHFGDERLGISMTKGAKTM